VLDVIDRVTDRRCQYPTIFLEYHYIFIITGTYISEVVVLSIPFFLTNVLTGPKESLHRTKSVTYELLKYSHSNKL